MTRDNTFEKTQNALHQITARQGRPIVICNEGENIKNTLATIEVPQIVDSLSGILNIIPFQYCLCSFLFCSPPPLFLNFRNIDSSRTTSPLLVATTLTCRATLPSRSLSSNSWDIEQRTSKYSSNYVPQPIYILSPCAEGKKKSFFPRWNRNKKNSTSAADEMLEVDDVFFIIFFF